MKKFKCPSCQQETITWGAKLRCSYWFTHVCSNCGVRVTATPILLALLHFFYVWVVLWFVALALYKNDNSYYLYLLVAYILLDLFNFYVMRLSSLKRRPPKNQE